MEIQIDPHTLERAEERGTNEQEIIEHISHDRQEETPAAKARWFQTLPLSQRMALLCAFTDLILAVNPEVVEQKDAQPVEGRVKSFQ